MYRNLVLFAFLLFFGFACQISKPYNQKDYISIYKDFAYKIKPILHKPSQYNGIVIQLKNNAEVFSIHRGIVLEVCDTCQIGKGKRITIKYKNDIKVTYYHLSEINVEPGQKVSKREKIAVSGSSGLTTVNCVGLEILQNNKVIDPYKILKVKEKLNE